MVQFIMITLFIQLLIRLFVGLPKNLTFNCGLVGFIGTEDFDLLKIKILFLYNESRGKDSAGIYVPNGGLLKVEGEVSKNLLPHFKWPKGNILLGHCRSATHGVKSAKNAHPFRRDDIVLTHNGTLTNWTEFSKRHNFWMDVNVDSDAMCMLFSKIKTEENIDNYVEEGLKEVDGAAAIMLYDKTKPNSITFFRNKERPLYYGIEYRESGMQYYFSSMQEGLQAIGIGKDDIFDVKENVIYTITDNVLTEVNFVKPAKIITLPATTTTNQSTVEAPKRENTILTNFSGKDYLGDFVSLRNKGINKLNGLTVPFTNNVSNVKTFFPDKITEDMLQIGTKVEFTNENGVKRNGTITGCSSIEGELYSIKDLTSGKLCFIQRELICETEDESEIVPESVNMTAQELFKGCVPKDAYYTAKEYCKQFNLYDKIEYADENGEVMYGYIVALPTFKNLTELSLEAQVQSAKSFETGDIQDEYVNIMRIKKTKKIMNDIDDIHEYTNFEDYDDASVLYTALLNTPGFDDEDNKFEFIMTMDTTLKNVIGLLDVNYIDKETITNIKEELLQQRGDLLNEMIDLAKKQEEDVARD